MKEVTVCCDTCKRKKEKGKNKPCGMSWNCLIPSDLMLYWSEEHGYLPKKYQHFSYDLWIPVKEEVFLEEEEFQL